MEAVEAVEAADMTIEAILAGIRTATSVTQLREATAKAIEALTTEAQLSIRVDDLESKVDKLEGKA